MMSGTLKIAFASWTVLTAGLPSGDSDSALSPLLTK